MGKYANIFDNSETIKKEIKILANSKYKPEYCEQLVEYMGKGFSYTTFAVTIEPNVNVDTLYEWEKVHPEFADAKRRGYNKGLKFFESLMVSKTMGVVPESLKALGSKGGDLTALIFVLKTRFHREYGEKQQIEIGTTGQNGFQISFVKNQPEGQLTEVEKPKIS